MAGFFTLQKYTNLWGRSFTESLGEANSKPDRERDRQNQAASTLRNFFWTDRVGETSGIVRTAICMPCLALASLVWASCLAG